MVNAMEVFNMPAKLTAQEIYDKQFPVSEKGYNAEQVDAFLDDIIEDYQDFEDQSRQLSAALIQSNEKVAELRQENRELNEQIESLQEAIARLSAENEELKNAAAAEDEVVVEEDVREEVVEPAHELTLEERVERLERAVFSAE